MTQSSRFSDAFRTRFFARTVEVDRGSPFGPCLEWQGSKMCGYGQLSCRAVSKQPLLAHRVAWELATGSAPTLHVLHHCDNPACVRFEHLFLGTQSDNNADRVKKGRTAAGDKNGARTVPQRNPFIANRGSGLFGEAHPQTKISDADVAVIRQLYTGKYGDLTRLGRRYGISSTQVLRIVTGVSRTLQATAAIEEDDDE